MRACVYVFTCSICYCTPVLTKYDICANLVKCIVPHFTKISLVVLEFPHRTDDCTDRWIDMVDSTVLHLLIVNEPKSCKDITEHAVVLQFKSA